LEVYLPVVNSLKDLVVLKLLINLFEIK